MAVDSAGDVWIGDAQNNRISRFADDGTFKENYETIGPLNTRPVGLSFAPDGDLLIADRFPGFERIIRAKTGAGPPPPVLGRAVNVQRVRGTVRIKLPAGSAGASQVKGTGFVPLSQARQIPVRSLLDTRRGTVRLTTRDGDRLGHAVRRVHRRDVPDPPGPFRADAGHRRDAAQGIELLGLQPRQEGEHEPALEAHGPPPARKRPGPLPNPRTPLGRHRARNDLDGDRPLRRHADHREARQGRRTRLQAQEDDQRESGKELPGKAP